MKGFSVRLLIACVALTAAAGCSKLDEAVTGPVERVGIGVNKQAYTAGETVAVTLINSRTQALTYNFCSWSLQKGSGTTWTQVATEPPGCVDQAQTLAPNASATTTVALPTTLGGGTYRIYYPNVNAATDAERASATFLVRAVE